MNEILQKRIEEAVKKTACPQCVFNDGGTCNNDDDCKLFDDFVGLMTFALQNQWISVDEALPTLDEKYDFSERYIVKTNEGAIKVMRIFKNIAWCDIFDGRAFIPFEKKIITHWMKIPNEVCEK